MNINLQGVTKNKQKPTRCYKKNEKGTTNKKLALQNRKQPKNKTSSTKDK